MRLLVVDDEAELTDPLAEGLGAEGFDVEVVHDGCEGLWRARERPYDVIILDVLLPGMNGFRVCEQLRRDGIATPILMLTVKSGEYDEADALDLGADDYLTKPFSFVVLLARIRALLRRQAAGAPTGATVGDLEVDVRQHRCRRGPVDVELTAQEFALLHALTTAAGAVVRRDELLDRVWGWDFDGNPGVLDVYIGYLRAKVDRPFGRRSIQTVRGVGFRLVDDR